MNALSLAIVVGLMGLQPAETPQAATGPQTWSSEELGLSLQHPASWTVEKRDISTVFLLPAAPGGDAPIIEIFKVNFRRAADEWQTIQAQQAQVMRRELDRQWQESVLGVPLLMTQISYRDGGLRMVNLNGLLYADTPNKMLFRLTAPSDAYDSALAAWREVLLSLRTLDNQLPTAEDPTRPEQDPVETETAPVRPATTVTLRPQGGFNGTPVLGDVGLRTAVGGREVIVRLPTGWVATEVDGGWTLRNAAVPGDVELSLGAEAADMPAIRAFLILTNASLEEFDSVRVRKEPLPKLNRAGASLFVMERYGKKGEEERAIVQAVGGANGFYWQMTYRPASEAAYKGASRLVNDLFDGTTIVRPE